MNGNTSMQSGNQNFGQNLNDNPSFNNYPQEAFMDSQQKVSSLGFNNTENQNGTDNMLPLLMQMISGKGGNGNLSMLTSLLGGGNKELSSLFSSISPKDIDKEKDEKEKKTFPKEDLIL